MCSKHSIKGDIVPGGDRGRADRLMRVVGPIGIVVLILIVTHGIIYPTYRYRYRLTVAVEIDGQVHTGSSVIEVIWSGGPKIGDMGPYRPSIRGQAVYLDLKADGVVVAALGNGESYGDASDGAVNALWLAARAFGNKSTIAELPQLPRLRGRRDLAPTNMPRLIWFTNPANPKTACKFALNDVPSLFGSSARLTVAYVEITDDPIVVDIDKRFSWFGLLNRPLADGVIQISYGFSLAKHMFVGDAS